VKRLFWVALGASVGVLLVRAVRTRTAKLTPAGASEAVGGAVAGLSESIRRLAEEVRAAAAEREAELVAALDLPDPKAPAPNSSAPNSSAAQSRAAHSGAAHRAARA